MLMRYRSEDAKGTIVALPSNCKVLEILVKDLQLGAPDVIPEGDFQQYIRYNDEAKFWVRCTRTN